MKYFYQPFFFGILFLFSCNSLRINIYDKEKEMPPLSKDKPVYIFYRSVEEVPDSAIYIGKITSGTNMLSYCKYLQRTHDTIKSNGANLIMIEQFLDEYETTYSGKIYLIKDFENTEYTEESIKALWQKRSLDKIEGFYETSLSDLDKKLNNIKIKFAIIRSDSSKYKMVYLSGYENLMRQEGYYCHITKLWRKGDVKAYIEKTEKSNLYISKFYTHIKYTHRNVMIKIDNGNLMVLTDKSLDCYVKTYPDSSKFYPIQAMLTGFALDKERIITCYHGITTDSINIYVKGINGDFETKYPVVLEASDKDNDIAILRLLDSTITINYLPFSISESAKSTGEDIFVLGYPISSIMGDEIKLTTGVLSSTSGLGGNQNFYQISAAIQPGSSGSPLFDNSGNIIGVINSGISSADNVGYALKLKSLISFLKSRNYSLTLQPENKYKDMNNIERVKTFNGSIFIIEANAKKPVDSN